MNMELIKNGLSQKFGRTGLVLQKHSPQILLGAGIVGVAVTVALAIKAAKKDDLKNEMQETVAEFEHIVAAENLSKEEEIQGKATIYIRTGLEYAKLYGPTIAVGSLSIAAILGAHGIMVKRQVALTAAYGLLAEAYKNYRARVVEVLGEEKDMEFHLGLREEKYSVTEEDEDGKKTKTKKTKLVATGPMPSMYARCFDNSNKFWQPDRNLNAAYITAQERYINDVLILEGHVFLNEVYKRLGFEPTPEGQLVGWVLRSPEQMKEEKRDGYISFGLDKYPANREFMRGENDAVWIDPNVDGIVFDLI